MSSEPAEASPAPAATPATAPHGDLYRIGNEPIELVALLAALEEPSLGGVAVFLGRVRSPNAGAQVRYLEYEGYEELALRTFAQIAEQLRARHGPSRYAMQHRLGRLAPGEVSLAVLVATPHRAAAFAACAEAVEECKRRLPVWKLEVTERGSHYVAGNATAAPTL